MTERTATTTAPVRARVAAGRSPEERVAAAPVASRRPVRTRDRIGRPARTVVRRVDTWTVFKLSLLFYFCVYGVLLVAGIILWNVAASFGILLHIEKFVRSIFDLSTFQLRPKVILEGSAAAGLVLILLGTLVNILMSLIYNLMSGVVGGIQLTVTEEVDS